MKNKNEYEVLHPADLVGNPTDALAAGPPGWWAVAYNGVVVSYLPTEDAAWEYQGWCTARRDSTFASYEPWTDGHAVGFRVTHKDGRVEFVYLNPSSDIDQDDYENVFLYVGPHGDPGEDRSVCYVNLFRP